MSLNFQPADLNIFVNIDLTERFWYRYSLDIISQIREIFKSFPNRKKSKQILATKDSRLKGQRFKWSNHVFINPKNFLFGMNRTQNLTLHFLCSKRHSFLKRKLLQWKVLNKTWNKQVYKIIFSIFNCWYV